MSIAIYIVPKAGLGTGAKPFMPDVPWGYEAWTVLQVRDDGYLVAVEASDEYHAKLRGRDDDDDAGGAGPGGRR